MDTSLPNNNNIINTGCVKMTRIILIFLILSNIINISSQQIYPLNITNQKLNTISVLNPTITVNSTISLFIGYSPYSFHYYRSGETMIYREGDMLWIYMKGSSIFNNTVFIELINPFNNIILSTTTLINKPINVYNFSNHDPTGYWLLKIYYNSSASNYIEYFVVRIFLINSKQNITFFNIMNQALTIEGGVLKYTVNGTLIFEQPITEYQALLFPINQSINTIVTSIHGERIKIIGLANNKLLIEADALIQFGIQASLKVQRPISISNISSSGNQAFYVVYWYPLLYIVRNATPSIHHRIIISLDRFNREPLILTISLLDPKSQQEYDEHSFNLLSLPSIGIYSYSNNTWNVYSEPVNRIVFQTYYENYVHTKYVLIILSKVFGLLYINKELVYPPFVKINVMDQSMNIFSNYQLTLINSSINTIFYDGATYILLTSNSSIINTYYNITIQDHKININYESFKKITLIPGSTIILNVTIYTMTINLYVWGKPLDNPSNIIFQINKLNNGGGAFAVESSPIILRLPPGTYNMKIFTNNILSWSENVTINSDYQTNIELYKEDPAITTLIIIVGGVVIISELIIGIKLIRKMFSK